MSTPQNQQPLFILRPKFASTQTILEALLVTVMVTLTLTAIGGTILMILFSFIGLGKFFSASLIYYTIFFISLLTTPALYYEVKRKFIKRSFYKFFPDRMEFVQFGKFFNQRQGRLRFKEVTDIVQRSNIIEQRDKVQTIYIWAPNFGFSDNRGFTGVALENISRNPNVIQTIERVVFQSDAPILPINESRAPLQEEPQNATIPANTKPTETGRS